MSIRTQRDRLRPWLRGLLAGPMTLLAACLSIVGGALVLPPGPAGVNNLALPVVLFPLVWAGLFLYACLDKRLARAYAIVGAVVALNGALLARHLLS